jgi:hypothetical protein
VQISSGLDIRSDKSLLFLHEDRLLTVQQQHGTIVNHFQRTVNRAEISP